ncbi:MAG: hypothetical protein PVG19_04580, partial [Desulfobacterales bacterium]
INQLENIRNSLANRPMPSVTRMGSAVTNESPEHYKIALFRTLLRGWEDVFAKRFESKRSGKSGYQPVGNNE